MSKERLEEIKDTWKYEDTKYLDNEDIEWLIEQAERVQGLEADVYNMDVELEKLYKQNKRYREALEFYASDETWKIDETNYSDADKYKGKVAREALEESK